MSKLMKIGPIVFILTLIINVISYPFLPAKMVTHIGVTGKANGSLPKLVGLLVIPIIMLVINYAYSKDPDSTAKVILTNIILFVVNIAIIAVNMTVFK